MATNITLSWFGPPEQKLACKVPPMQSLAEAAQAVSSKFKPALAANTFELHLNKKPVDLNTPFRLLNVPAGSKLEVIRKAAAHQPAQPAAAATAPQPAAAPPAAAPSPAAAAVPAEPPPAPQPTAPVVAAPAPPPAPAAAAASQQEPDAEAPPAEEQAAAAAPAAATGADPALQGAAATASSSPLAALGVQGPIYVFHQRVLEAAAAAQAPSAMEVDPPDEFFEMTLDDLARLQQQAAAKKKQEAAFRPAAVREAEAAARASALGPVRVRLHLPDGTLLQTAFRATDPLRQVQGLLHKVAAPEVAAALYLYTTPPKTVLKDMAATLYQLQLVPAAHLYVGCDEKKLTAAAAGKAAGSSSSSGGGGAAAAGPFLRPEVLALMQDSVPEPAAAADAGSDDPAATGSSSASAADAQRAVRLAAAASRQAGSSGASAGAGGGDAGKVPKWMKLGKK